MVVRALRVQLAVVLKDDGLRGIDKGETEIGGDDLGIEVFAAAGHIIPLVPGFQVLADDGKLDIQAKADVQLPNDLLEALLNLRQNRLKILVGRGQLLAAVEQVRDLDVLLEALSGSGADHIPPRGVCPNDLRRLADLGCAGQAGSSEFHYDRFHVVPLTIYIKLLPQFCYYSARRKKCQFSETPKSF